MWDPERTIDGMVLQMRTAAVPHLLEVLMEGFTWPRDTRERAKEKQECLLAMAIDGRVGAKSHGFSLRATGGPKTAELVRKLMIRLSDPKQRLK